MQTLKQISLIVEKRVVKKSKDVNYEIFSITTAKDALDKDFYPKVSVGVTSVSQIEAEITEYQYKIDYRKKILQEIADLDKRKAKHTDYEEAVKYYIENNK